MLFRSRNQYKVLAEKYTALKESESGIDFDDFESIFHALYNSNSLSEFTSIVTLVYDDFYNKEKNIRDLEDYVQVTEESLEPALSNAIGYIYWLSASPGGRDCKRYESRLKQSYMEFKELRDAKEGLAKQNKQTGINLDI